MSHFKLICEDEALPFMGASKLKQEFETEDLFHILSNVTIFLRKSGYLSKEQKLELGREINLDEFTDLDEYTENLFNHANETVVVGGGSDTVSLSGIDINMGDLSHTMAGGGSSAGYSINLSVGDIAAYSIGDNINKNKE
jgi:hypothetical protein